MQKDKVNNETDIEQLKRYLKMTHLERIQLLIELNKTVYMLKNAKVKHNNS